MRLCFSLDFASGAHVLIRNHLFSHPDFATPGPGVVLFLLLLVW